MVPKIEACFIYCEKCGVFFETKEKAPYRELCDQCLIELAEQNTTPGVQRR